MGFWQRHLGTVGGLLAGAGAATGIEVLKAEGPVSSVVGAVAIIELLSGLVLIALHSRRK